VNDVRSVEADLHAALLGSWVQPLVILITVPFGWIGSIIGHMIMGYDLTLMSLFGMVAVSGIVVNHSLVIVDALREALIAQMSNPPLPEYSGDIVILRACKMPARNSVAHHILPRRADGSLATKLGRRFTRCTR
jgi:hypothetical protein